MGRQRKKDAQKCAEYLKRAKNLDALVEVIGLCENTIADACFAWQVARGLAHKWNTPLEEFVQEHCKTCDQVGGYCGMCSGAHWS